MNMERTTREETLLLYALAYAYNNLEHPRPNALREDPRTGIFQPILDYAGQGVLTPQHLEALIAHVSKGQSYNANGMSWHCSNEQFCVQYSIQHRPCENSQLLLRELERLRQLYAQATHQGVNLYTGFLQFIGDNFMTRNLLLKMLALAQSIENTDVARCWEMLVIYALDPFTFDLQEELESLLTEVRTSEAKGFAYWGGVLGQDLGVEKDGDIIRLSFASVRTRRCSLQLFLQEVEKLLASYELAIAS